jgi:Fic family protein
MNLGSTLQVDDATMILIHRNCDRGIKVQVDEFDANAPGRLVPISGYDNFLRRDYAHRAYVPDALPYELALKQGTYKAASDAAMAIGRLDFAIKRLPNPSLLVRPALRREAQSTSALEGTYAPLHEILEADYSDEASMSHDMREIRNYIRAAEHALEAIKTKPICVTMLCELQETLVKGTRGDNSDRGRLRTGVVYIGERTKGIEASRFVPPPATEVPEAMSDWEKWINNAEDIADIINLALAHYQFETIHPFSDGNGRVGRLVATLQLVTREALAFPVLNLSSWFEPRKDQYKDELLNVSKTGDFDRWIRFFCDAVIAAAEDGTQRIEDLLTFSKRVRAELEEAKARGVVLKIADDLIGYPVITPSEAAELYDVTYPPANTAIKKLESMGILREVTGGTYGRMYICDEVVRILERD